MAPESERAKCKCGRPRNDWRHAPIGEYSAERHGFDPAPHEPTLTCSEVVERLAECVYGSDDTCGLDLDKAEAILHSWRERRVQELERAVKIASCQLAQGSNMDFSDANIERWQEEAQRIEQQLLIEARAKQKEA